MFFNSVNLQEINSLRKQLATQKKLLEKSQYNQMLLARAGLVEGTEGIHYDEFEDTSKIDTTRSVDYEVIDGKVKISNSLTPWVDKKKTFFSQVENVDVLGVGSDTVGVYQDSNDDVYLFRIRDEMVWTNKKILTGAVKPKIIVSPYNNFFSITAKKTDDSIVYYGADVSFNGWEQVIETGGTAIRNNPIGHYINDEFYVSFESTELGTSNIKRWKEVANSFEWMTNKSTEITNHQVLSIGNDAVYVYEDWSTISELAYLWNSNRTEVKISVNGEQDWLPYIQRSVIDPTVIYVTHVSTRNYGDSIFRPALTKIFTVQGASPVKELIADQEGGNTIRVREESGQVRYYWKNNDYLWESGGVLTIPKQIVEINKFDFYTEGSKVKMFYTTETDVLEYIQFDEITSEGGVAYLGDPNLASTIISKTFRETEPVKVIDLYVERSNTFGQSIKVYGSIHSYMGMERMIEMSLVSTKDLSNGNKLDRYQLVAPNPLGDVEWRLKFELTREAANDSVSIEGYGVCITY
jgi:hypothetical protein